MHNQGGKGFAFRLAMALAGFFIYSISPAISPSEVGAAETGKVLINEVQIQPVEKRFVELYNPNDFIVDLTGWYLQRKTQTGASFSSLVSKTNFENKNIAAHGYFLISRTALAGADVVLDNLTLTEGNTIQLKNSAGEITDKVGWGAAGDCEGNCAAGPAENQSLQRKYLSASLVDADNNFEDFTIQACPSPATPSTVCPAEAAESPGEQNDQATTTPQSDNNTASSTSEAVNPQQPYQEGVSPEAKEYKLGDVLINEFVSDPDDNEEEWIELYNTTDEEINLSDWKIEDGSKAKTGLSGSLGAGGDNRFLVIEKPKGNLNNSGDSITLFDAGGGIIDQVIYGDWDDGNLSANAPAAHDPASTARIISGRNTFNNANDFALTLKPTRGSSNIIYAEEEVAPESRAAYDFSPEIYLSEILPNPLGEDAKQEFIEIHNAGAREVNLTGWSLANEDNKKIYLEKISTTTMIKPKDYLALFRPKTKIVLHNDQGQVKLFQPLAEQAWQTVKYKQGKEGSSYNANLPINTTAAKINLEWAWGEAPTPGTANRTEIIAPLPEVEFSFSDGTLAGQPIVFDSTDTIWPSEAELKYFWDFGDGFNNLLANPEHTFFQPGIYKVKLTVSDDRLSAEKERSVKVVASSTWPVNGTGEITAPAFSPREGKIIINEIFPDPEGADAGQEWAELKNQSGSQINLLNWRLENSNGKYKFKNDLWLAAENFLLLSNRESKLAFKNTDDVIVLYNNLEELVDEVEYQAAVQGEAYARGENGSWFWTTRLTPKEENIIKVSDSQASVRNQEAGNRASAEKYLETELSQVKEMEIGSLVKVAGVVAVKPGVLGAQIFYLLATSSDSEFYGGAAQIYNYKKDFPALEPGDYLEVTGELGQIQGEARIKTKTKADFVVKGRLKEPDALTLSCDQVDEDFLGQLIVLNGEITDKKSSTVYLDDGSGEIFVYFKKTTGIETKNLQPGQRLSVTGILSKTSSGLRLLPRSPDDIIQTGLAEKIVPRVLGEAIEAPEWSLAGRDKKTEFLYYLLVIASGMIAVLIVLLVKKIKQGDRK